jgi:hypothetical protein
MRGKAAQKSPQWGDFRRNSEAKRRHAVSGQLLRTGTHKPRSADKSLFASFSSEKEDSLLPLKNPPGREHARADR